MRVDTLTSIQTLLPYDYYSLPFVQPHREIKEAPENLGEYLSGERIKTSPYHITTLVNENCKLLRRVKATKEDCAAFEKAIEDQYNVNWILDNLPSAAAIDDEETKTQTTTYDIGFPIGHPRIHNGKLLGVELNNHAKISISYHAVGSDEARIVGFLVEPISVKHTYAGQWNEAAGASQLTSCYRERPMPPLDSRRTPLYLNSNPDHIIWTYDVMWRPSKIEWASRWDTYLSMAGRYDDEVHWFSIINALLIVLFLSGMVAMIMVRSLHRDITRYNRVMSEDERAEEREESGWKLVHADVFRPPAHAVMYCVAKGTGMQLFGQAISVLLFSAIGFLSPANRGYMVIALLLLFVFMGVPAGYTANRTYKMFKGRDWQRVTLLTAMTFPGVSFCIFFVLNLFCWAEGSVRAVPFGSMCVMVLLWFGVSVPLVYIGAYIGYRKPAIEFPVRVSSIPRAVPAQQWYMTTTFAIIIGGILPFGAVFVELYFILSSIWLGQYYYVFGFLLIVFTILSITCAEITIVLCYFQLCAEDYNWWWRSFLSSASTGVYIFAYSIFYFFTNLQAHYLVTALLYFGYMFVISFAMFLLTGCIGATSSLWFCSKIYSSIKVD